MVNRTMKAKIGERKVAFIQSRLRGAHVYKEIGFIGAQRMSQKPVLYPMLHMTVVKKKHFIVLRIESR